MNTAVASAVEEQGATTQEIARNTQEAASGAAQVSEGIAKVSAASGRTGEGAAEVLHMCGELAASTDTLEREVSEFVGSIRALPGPSLRSRRGRPAAGAPPALSPPPRRGAYARRAIRCSHGPERES